MAYTLQKIGKSLVKYFKPIRVTPPHLPGDPSSASKGASGNLDDEGKKGFRLLNFKKPARDRFAESKEKLKGVNVEESALEQVETAALPEKAPSQWLDLVVFLLGACKRASQKVKKRVALETYRTAALARGRTKIRTVGSIIDTTGEVISALDEKKAG